MRTIPAIFGEPSYHRYSVIRGEHLANLLVVGVEDIIASWPDAWFTVLFQRPDNERYPAATGLTAEDGRVYYLLTNTDTAVVGDLRVAMDAVSTTVAETGNADAVIRCLQIHPAWAPGDYRHLMGQVRLYAGYPYRVYQPHDSTHNPDWTPEGAPALWIPYHGTMPETALPYRQPTGAHDMYKAGECMIWTDGTVYRCAQDTVYSPETYAQAWEAFGES